MRAHLDACRRARRGPARAGGTEARGQGGRRAVARRRAKRITYRVGPFDIVPGQNSIGFRAVAEKPQVDGYITRIRPDLTYVDGRVPRVDVIHLHHGGVAQPGAQRRHLALPARALLRGRRGEDAHAAPEGLRLSAQGDGRAPAERHDPQPHARSDAALLRLRDRLRAQGLAARHAGSARCGRSGWTWRTAGATRSSTCGRAPADKGRYTYPNDARSPYRGGPKKNQWVVDRPGVLVATAGHLHPGGLYTDLKVRRGRRTRAAVPVGGQVLRAGRRGLLGRRDDRHASRLAREGPEGRCPVHERDLRHKARLVVRSRWGSWSPTWRTGGRARTRSRRA